ncbi:MAG: hypothetical protein AB1609_22075 [Bacillota bacterium]
MPEEGWVVFPTLEAARAAFSLGPVKYRCLACGKVHVSGTNRGRKCLSRLAQLCGWQPPPVPVPPAPKNLDLPYRFASTVLKEFIGDWEAARFARDLPEYLLALDPRADIRAALEQCLDELTAEARAAADRAWETYDFLWRWLDALAECRPPCVVAAVLRSRRLEEYGGSQWIARRFWLRPSVPCPVAGKEELLAVLPDDYSHTAVTNPVWVGYGRRGFGAVGVWHVWDPSRRAAKPDECEIMRQFYGHSPEVRTVSLWNRDPGELPRVFGRITEDLARAIEAPPVWGIANPVQGWVVTDGCCGYLDGAGGKLPAPFPGRVKVYATRAEALAAAGGLEGHVEEVVVAQA